MGEPHSAYPLAWPAWVPRTNVRKTAAFSKKVDDGRGYSNSVNLTVADAAERLYRELDLLKAKQVVVSTNIQPRLDGKPRSGQSEPLDPGIAVYFQLGTKAMCMPCDRWTRVADNLAAVAAHIDAVRRIDRYGVGTTEQAFAGFEALPSPEHKRDWRDVLEMRSSAKPTADQVEQAFRRLARERHPDSGGSDAMMAELNEARADARKELGGG